METAAAWEAPMEYQCKAAGDMELAISGLAPVAATVCSAPASEETFIATQAPQQCRGTGLDGLQSSIGVLDHTADELSAVIRSINTVAGARQQVREQPGRAQSAEEAAHIHSSHNQVQELQQQLAALLAEKQRVEADRQEMALQQGQFKGTIAQLEGALSFSERKVKDQMAAMEKLQAQVLQLNAELQQARGAAAVTPDRCRTAARALQAEADRATTHARSNEAQVKKLKQIVQVEARQLSELLDFAEQERLTLLEKEAALQQDLNQTREHAAAAEASAAHALATAASLEQQLAATRDQLLACESRTMQLEQLLAAAEGQLQQAAVEAGMLAAERDAAARNLVRAEAELNDVSEYSTKMFRQVRFISHILDKNHALLGKLPDFAGLARDLRAFVAANARNWEHRDDDRGQLSAGMGGTMSTAAAGGSIVTDTAASGLRDVLGKA